MKKLLSTVAVIAVFSAFAGPAFAQSQPGKPLPKKGKDGDEKSITVKANVNTVCELAADIETNLKIEVRANYEGDYSENDGDLLFGAYCNKQGKITIDNDGTLENMDYTGDAPSGFTKTIEYKTELTLPGNYETSNTGKTADFSALRGNVMLELPVSEQTATRLLAGKYKDDLTIKIESAQ